MTKKADKPVLREPIDISRCQAEVGTAFAIGGDGQPRRCKEKPTHVVFENEKDADGAHGGMSLCDDCLRVFLKQVGEKGHTILPLDANRSVMGHTQSLITELLTTKQLSEKNAEKLRGLHQRIQDAIWLTNFK